MPRVIVWKTLEDIEHYWYYKKHGKYSMGYTLKAGSIIVGSGVFSSPETHKVIDAVGAHWAFPRYRYPELRTYTYPLRNYIMQSNITKLVRRDPLKVRHWQSTGFEVPVSKLKLVNVENIKIVKSEKYRYPELYVLGEDGKEITEIIAEQRVLQEERRKAAEAEWAERQQRNKQPSADANRVTQTGYYRWSVTI
jgi:hypothetical protein